MVRMRGDGENDHGGDDESALGIGDLEFSVNILSPAVKIVAGRFCKVLSARDLAEPWKNEKNTEKLKEIEGAVKQITLHRGQGPERSGPCPAYP